MMKMQARCDRCSHEFRVLYGYVVCPYPDCQGILIPVEQDEPEIDLPIAKGSTRTVHERSLGRMYPRTDGAPPNSDFWEWELELRDPHSGYDAVLDAWERRTTRPRRSP